MSQTIFYQKYRSQSFKDMVGQEHIVQILTNAINLEQLAHAYIFSGPRGTGKTSTARILAKSLNCQNGPTAEPCLTCDLCKKITAGHSVDVIEIDAASNTGVDNIRSLNEKVNYTPVECKYKLYIIDEAHMLSTGAFNALLKTLEEPPKNTLFILATTEPQKILATIHSRCQHLNFRKLSPKEIADHVSFICKEESIAIDEKSLQLIARHSGGCMRDALSLLNQVVAFTGNTVTADNVLQLVGNTDVDLLVNMFNHLVSAKESELITMLTEAFQKGVQPVKLCQSWVLLFKWLTYAKLGLTQHIECDDDQIKLIQEAAQKVSVPWLKYALDRFSKLELELKQFPDQELMFQIRLITTKIEGKKRPAPQAQQTHAQPGQSQTQGQPVQQQAQRLSQQSAQHTQAQGNGAAQPSQHQTHGITLAQPGAQPQDQPAQQTQQNAGTPNARFSPAQAFAAATGQANPFQKNQASSAQTPQANQQVSAPGSAQPANPFNQGAGSPASPPASSPFGQPPNAQTPSTPGSPFSQTGSPASPNGQSPMAQSSHSGQTPSQAGATNAQSPSQPRDLELDPSALTNAINHGAANPQPGSPGSAMSQAQGSTQAPSAGNPAGVMAQSSGAGGAAGATSPDLNAADGEQNKWKRVISEIKDKHKSIYAYLNGASLLSIEGSAVKIKLTQSQKFFQDAVKSQATKDAIGPILGQYFGNGTFLDPIIDATASGDNDQNEGVKKKKINDIVTMFEGTLVKK